MIILRQNFSGIYVAVNQQEEIFSASIPLHGAHTKLKCFNIGNLLQEGYLMHFIQYEWYP